MTAPARGRRAGAAAARRASDRGPRRFAMSRSNVRRSIGLMAGLAAMLLSSGAGARELEGADGRCRVTIPDRWTAPDGRSPDGVVTIQIREVSSGRVFVSFQSAFGVRTSSDPNRDLTIMYARAGNMTRYFGVAPNRGRRACIAQITSSRTEGNAVAEQIAGTLRRLDR